MYKGYKITKHLQRYMRYAKVKYEKMKHEGRMDLWEILQGYDYIMEQAKCIQLYIYDWILGEMVNYQEYVVTCSIDGGVYVKKRIDEVAKMND